MMTFLATWVRPILLLLGLAALLAAERYLKAEAYAPILLYFGLGAVAMSTLMPLVQALLIRATRPSESQSWLYVFSWQAVISLGIGLYFAYNLVLGDVGTVESLAAKALLATYLACLTVGVVGGIGVETVMWQSGLGSLAEPRRVGQAFFGWASIGMLVVSAFALAYASIQWNKTYDWSYLKTTTPSEATLNMAKTLTSELEITLFYPETNEVRQQVEPYFRTLAEREPKIQLSFVDKDMKPALAEALRVSRNGIIAIKSGEKTARLETGSELAKARDTLRKLDEEFQKRFLELTRSKRTAYFTRGHGEASWLASTTDEGAEKSIRGLEAILRSQNYDLRKFGVAEGSVTDVPEQVDLVVVAGPTRPFAEEEVAVLKRFLERGGNLLVFLDRDEVDATGAEALTPEADPLLELLKNEVGIGFDPAPLANDRDHVNANRGDADRWFLITNIFTSHESVSTLARHEERIALMLLQAGRLQVEPEKNGWKSFETVRSLANTFVDANRNFRFDPETEKRETHALAAAATKSFKQADGSEKTAKIMVVADATLVSDLLIRLPVHQVFFMESVKWAVGDTQFAGELSSEEDVRIVHSRKENSLRFYLTIVVVPLFVLGVGFLGTMSGRKRRRSTVTDAI